MMWAVTWRYTLHGEPRETVDWFEASTAAKAKGQAIPRLIEAGYLRGRKRSLKGLSCEAVSGYGVLPASYGMSWRVP